MGDGAAPSDSLTRWPGWLVPVVATVQAVVVLGPALGRGLVITYDMAWSPDPRFTPFVLGSDTPAPRAVPSDATAVLIGHALGAELTQKALLLGLLIGLGLGAAALLAELSPSSGTAARLAATVASVWNPFVHERLVVGQWTVLLGLAVLPWALRSGLRVVAGRGGPRSVAAVVAVAGLGGANTLVMVLLPLLAVLVTGALVGPRGRRSGWSAGVAAIVGLGMSAAWSLPALLSGAQTTEAGVAAFLPAADTPLGVIGSLASGGAFWNTATHPASRSVPLVAAAAALLALLGLIAVFSAVGGSHRWVLMSAIGVPTTLVMISVAPGLQPVWESMVMDLPGGGILRDSHKLVAPWLLIAAVGIGFLVERASRDIGAALVGPTVALLVALPVALSPLLAWGASGRLAAAGVPQSYRTAMEQVNDLPPGDVGLLPWSQYRRYEWNRGRVSLTVAPRMVEHTVVFDDSLPLRTGDVAGESRRAALVTTAITNGASPTEALRASGVRYLIVERRAGGEVDEMAVKGSGVLRLENSALIVVELADPAAPSSGKTGVVVGWLLTVATFGSVAAGMVVRGVGRRRL